MSLLTGVLVADFSQAEAGPIASLVLSDLGARVIKIERWPGGDLLRSGWGHEFADNSLPFASLNRGKESLCVNLKHPQGRELIDRLLGRTDVLIHNFRPGVMERLGLGYEELRHRYPRLVYAEISGYGSRGPLAGQGGQDLLAQALSGVMWQNSPHGDRPLPVGFPVADYAAGMSVAIGILAALWNRERAGRGCKIETSLLGSLVFAMLQEVAEAALGHRLVQGDDPVAGVFRAKDGYIVVMPIWRETAVSEFLESIGLGGLAQDPRMLSKQSRARNRDWVRSVIEGKLRERSVQFWQQVFESRDILSAPVLSYDRMLQHSQVLALGCLGVARSGELCARVVRTPITVQDDEEGVGYGEAKELVPRLGEHSRAIMAELGYCEEEIQALVEVGAVLVSRHRETRN